MGLEGRQLDDQLLAYHMGWLTRNEMHALERLIACTPEVAARSRVLEKAVAPLQDWASLPVVEDLEEQIVQRVRREAGAALLPVEQVVRMAPVTGDRGSMVRLPVSWKEVIAVAASVALLFILVLPGLARASAESQRTVCADRLRQIAAALNAYGHEHAGQLPFVGGSGNWLREPTAGVQRFRNSQNRFALLALGYLGDAQGFVCPSDRQAVVMRFETLSLFDDFAEPRNCSYDSQITHGFGKHMADHPGLVVYSDSNPIFDRPVAAEDLSTLNSRHHEGLSGQNVIRLTGDVTWASSPNVGVQNDNIWQIGQHLNYTGSELPEFATDSFLIP